MTARLIAISKTFPKIGKISQYRPIVVTSFIVKFLQLVIAEELQRWASKNLSQKQFGFCKNVSIEECKTDAQKIIKELKRTTNKENRAHVIYIDLKGAYDSVPQN